MRTKIQPMRASRSRPAVRFAGALLALTAVIACQWDKQPDSPYLPGSADYAGDDWSHDGDGNGVADSVEKYVPGCALSPGFCLRNARILEAIPPERFGLRADNLRLWLEDGPKSLELAWSPPEAALRSYSLESSDSGIVSFRGDSLVPKSAGECRIKVLSPGPVVLHTQFKVVVVSGGIRVKSLHASDLVLRPGQDTVPALEWDPTDATYRGYSLTIEPESVAVSIGDSIRGKLPGRAKGVVTTADGGFRAEFSVLVRAIPKRTVLTAGPLRMGVGDSAVAPDLTWDPPTAAEAGYSLSLPDTSSIVAVTADAGKLIPLREGTARVRVVSADGQAQADFQVTVFSRSVPVTGLKADDLLIGVNDAPRGPGLHWTPEDATDQGYILSTRDSAVAVPVAGKIKPVGPGQTIFVATSHDGGHAVEFQVKVAADSNPKPKPDPDSVTGISVAALSLATGVSRIPVFSWTPATARKPGYTLVSEDSAIARVAASDSGPCLQGRLPGTTQVVLSVAGGLSATFPVTVTSSEIAVISIQSPDIALDIKDPPYDPVVTFTPPEATDKSYTLIAPEPAGAFRIEANKVVPVRTGKSPLRIVPESNPAAALICSVTVTARVRGLSVRNDTLTPGEDRLSLAGRLTWDPPEAAGKSYRLASLSPAIVSITPGDTAYHAVAPGTAKLVATAQDGSGALDTFTVLVRIPITRIIAKDLTMRAGDPVLNPWFIFTFVPSNASNQGWSFEYPDPATAEQTKKVVEIVDNWKLQAHGTGTAQLIAYSLDNVAIRDTFTVTVRPGQYQGAGTSAEISPSSPATIRESPSP